ncbi:MAG: MFS transporter [Propioniciclava sp.]
MSNVPKNSGRGFNLALALTAYTITFWAWNLVGPLAVRYAADLELDPAQVSMLVATPVIVGSVGRILTGALTDRLGGRVMFTLLSIVSAVPVLLVLWAGEIASYPLLLVFGFLLGIAGTTFAVGIPFVNAWYDPSRRGFATGVFGAGMGGTALSSFFTPRLVATLGYQMTHILVAVALVAGGIACWLWLRDAPDWSPSREPVLPKLLAAARLEVTWHLAVLYAVIFGGFVAFSTYLPTYLNNVYGYDLTDAGSRTAGFAMAAVLSRPVGGWLSDRWGPAQVITLSLGAAAVGAVMVAFKPPPEIAAGAAFLWLAAALGLGSGAVFTWVAQRAPASQVGSVTGIVGAAGGLGGYFPPLVMGATYNPATQSYLTGLLLLAVTTGGTLLFTLVLAQLYRSQDRLAMLAAVSRQP